MTDKETNYEQLINLTSTVENSVDHLYDHFIKQLPHLSAHEIVQFFCLDGSRLSGEQRSEVIKKLRDKYLSKYHEAIGILFCAEYSILSDQEKPFYWGLQKQFGVRYYLFRKRSFLKKINKTFIEGKK